MLRRNTVYRAFLILAVFFLMTSCFRRVDTQTFTENPFNDINTEQIDDLLLEMPLEEKIGQLIIGKTSINYSWDEETILGWVRDGMVGGLILENLTIENYSSVVWKCKNTSQIPLFFGTNQQVSLHNQFSELVRFPNPSTIGSIDSIEIQQTISRHFLQQCKGLGINLTFSPSLTQNNIEEHDYNLNGFENDPFESMARSIRKIQGLRKNKILSIGNDLAKYAEISIDSLTSQNEYERYEALIQSGISGFLISKRIFQSDTFHHHPQFFLSEFFNKRLKYNGLFIANLSKTVSLEKAFHAGTDLFVTSDVPKTFKELMKLKESGRLTETMINEKVRKILSSKSWSNRGKLKIIKKHVQDSETNNPKAHFTSEKTLHKTYGSSSIKKITQSLKMYFEDSAWEIFTKRLFEQSVILASNPEELIPYQDLYAKDFRIIQFGAEQNEVFKHFFGKYAPFKSSLHKPNYQGQFSAKKIDEARWAVPVIILDNIDFNNSHNQSLISEINKINTKTRTVLINFGDPRNLIPFDSSLVKIQIFEKNDFTEAFAAKLLFGGVSSNGRLPINLNVELPFGTKTSTTVSRLNYFESEAVGIDSDRLDYIDSIAEEGIKNRATPGCQVLIAKKGNVIYSKSFGHHTYKQIQKVKTSDLYDVASVTKIAATTLSTMKMVDSKKLFVEDTIGKYIAEIDSHLIKSISVKELLIHQSGLQPNMPISRFIWNNNIAQNGCNQYFCGEEKENYSIKILPGLFFNAEAQDQIWENVFQLEVGDKFKFKYSDVNFNMLQKIIESKDQLPLDDYVFQNFYKPLGMQRTAFNPLKIFHKTEIVPTERDTIWRNQLLRGTVHDPTAALLGGVCGSAGLFANAEDLVILFQMLLNEGTYGGQRYLDNETVNKFTSATELNQRGLGFNKPGLKLASGCSGSASSATYGHSGFTGTCVWVDPTHDLIYIFLSNRVHPYSGNRKLLTEQIRKRIHQVVYDAFDTYELKLPKLDFVLTQS